MLGELLTLGLKVTVLGLGTTFVALFGLIIAIELINKIVNQGLENKKKQSTVEASIVEGETSGANISLEDTSTLDNEDEELIAVITAAIAASLNRSTHDIIVRSFRRVPHHAPAWNLASRRDQITTRL